MLSKVYSATLDGLLAAEVQLLALPSDTIGGSFTLTLDGPMVHEMDIFPNPFTDVRFTVAFCHESGEPRYVVPGYFAAADVFALPSEGVAEPIGERRMPEALRAH